MLWKPTGRARSTACPAHPSPAPRPLRVRRRRAARRGCPAAATPGRTRRGACTWRGPCTGRRTTSAARPWTLRPFGGIVVPTPPRRIRRAGRARSRPRATSPPAPTAEIRRGCPPPCPPSWPPGRVPRPRWSKSLRRRRHHLRARASPGGRPNGATLPGCESLSPCPRRPIEIPGRATRRSRRSPRCRHRPPPFAIACVPKSVRDCPPHLPNAPGSCRSCPSACSAGPPRSPAAASPVPPASPSKFVPFVVRTASAARRSVGPTRGSRWEPSSSETPAPAGRRTARAPRGAIGT
mmetsp:Transcript_32141/g.68419  ORF Transcript_32141/g.68419 Transcript_32141/m.68419 type:complete len:294 (+) Transcript_32141:540-1421(+)